MGEHRSTVSKRVAVFIPNLLSGGAERYAVNMSNGLSQRGHAVDLVVGDLTGPLSSEVSTNVRLIDLGRRRAVTSLPRLMHYLRRERPDVMISALTRANVVAVAGRALARVSTSVVVSHHSTSSEEEKGSRRSARGVALALSAKVAYPRADEIVAVSMGVASDLSHLMGLARERITVIYNPVITPLLLAGVDGVRVDHPWLENPDVPLIVAVGRLNRQKGFDFLVEAFAEVRANRSARLLILGDGEDREQLEALIRHRGLEEDIDMPGHVGNPLSYVSRASAFVLSSRSEGLPTALIEALVCQIPIVSTDCPSGPREILKAGEYGVLTPVGDRDAMVAAIERALDGEVPPPPSESWAPFEVGTVMASYERLLFTGSRHL